MKRFELVANGCLYATVEASSFRAAREYFAAKFTGRYEIICENGESKNVMLKQQSDRAFALVMPSRIPGTVTRR